MPKLPIEILLTIGLSVLFVLLGQSIKYGVIKFTRSKAIDANRKKIILNFFYALLFILFFAFLALIWRLNIEEFIVFLGSILAVLGVGFFAQWSLLSNLTSSVILFFMHPMRIGDRIRIINKDYIWVGTLTNISGFYLYLTTDSGEKITFPNSLVMQHAIEILADKPKDIE